MLDARFLSLGTLFLALAACGGATDESRSEDAQEAASAPESAPPLMVEVTDSLGQFEGNVTAIALWQHPTASFRSAILAANGPAGLFLIPIDRSAPTAVTGNFSGAVAIGYTGAEAVAAAYDQELGGIRFFSVDPDARELGEFTLASTGDGAKALCFVGATLFRVADEGAVYRHQMTVEDGAVVVDVMSVPSVNGTACASGTNLAYILSDNGRVVPISAQGEVQTSLEAPTDAVSIAAFSTAEGDKLVFALEDGIVVAGEKALLLTDNSGPLATRTLVAGGGNFGGAYRDGALGFISKENYLGVVSWLALSNNVGIEGRSISPQGEDAGVSSDLARQRTPPEGDLSRDLDEEAKERLDSFRAPPTGDEAE